METPQLKILMSAYYNQDWTEIGLWETAAEYIHDADVEERAQLTRDIEAVLATVPASQLGTVVRDLGGYVRMDDDRGGYRGWLEEISRRVVATTG